MEKRNLYVIVAIVLIAGLALSFYSNFTGYQTSTLGTDKGKCIDTDGGFNIGAKGTIRYANREYSYTDYCYEAGKGPGKYVNEYYCEDGIQSDERNCNQEEGFSTCRDGACVP